MTEDDRKRRQAAALQMMSEACTTAGLSAIEAAAVAAQFVGECIAKTPGVEPRTELLSAAALTMVRHCTAKVLQTAAVRR